MPTLGDALLARYPRFSLYNSPYPAHDLGCAVDLYPDREDEVAPSPVAGTVLDIEERRVPAKEYAEVTDTVLLVAVDEAATPGLTLDGNEYDEEWVARVLHVDPSVVPGDEVEPGQPLGRLVRSGFFAPWVANHLHLELRHRGANLLRARGSPRLALDTDVAITPVGWDGHGTVVEAGKTYVRLDRPASPGSGWAALASDDGAPLDGGLPHYAGGGRFGSSAPRDEYPVSLLGQRVGVVRDRDVEWADVAVRLDGEPVTGLSLFVGREELGAKVVARGHDHAVGDEVQVDVVPTDDPVRLG
ncbi:hypothetical protein [Haloglomus litoreum]|uniref:hypothetical protein n=1 Tax=Haloglomus litoreum TaxID=3034026 RepID=UPI0023E87A5C|nr:hypothetical protein [Haloglomus sp. DT116]